MNGNLIRPEYYDEDHILNEQEFKEFNFVRIDPYWKIRSSCYSLSLNCFGDKANLIRKIENLLFNNHLHKKPATDTCKDLASLDIELMVKNLKCSSGKFDSVRYEDLERYCNGEVDKKVPEEQVFKHQWPWHVVVELNKMQKNLSYQDIYKGLSFLMRPCMAFYNHFLEGNHHFLSSKPHKISRRMYDRDSSVTIYTKDVGLFEPITDILYCQST